jgi:hypothetical protein
MREFAYLLVLVCVIYGAFGGLPDVKSRPFPGLRSFQHRRAHIDGSKVSHRATNSRIEEIQQQLAPLLHKLQLSYPVQVGKQNTACADRENEAMCEELTNLKR